MYGGDQGGVMGPEDGGGAQYASGEVRAVGGNDEAFSYCLQSIRVLNMKITSLRQTKVVMTGKVGQGRRARF